MKRSARRTRTLATQGRCTLRQSYRSGTSQGPLILIAVVALLGLSGVLFYFGPTDDAPYEDLRTPPERSAGQLPERDNQLTDLRLQPMAEGAPPVRLADLAGRVVVINFWGTWCGPCRDEFPSLVKMYERYKNNRSFQILFVSCSPGEDEELSYLRKQTAQFLKTTGYEVPVYFDLDAATRRAFHRAHGFRAYPTTFILDGTAKIRGCWTGNSRGADVDMESLVQELLEAASTAKPASGPAT